uniref:SCP domain-containing protein n=1 Tax=Globodera pallida TaxID=36090 RepID=A0A183BJF1_GLOPA
MLARHSEPRDNHECIQSLRYQGKYPLGIVEILQDGWKWGITEANANKWSESQKCYNDVSCETYRCKDGDGKEKFVLNACAREKITDAKSTKCTLHDELGLYCNNPDNPVCSQCYGTKCNENRINLKVPEVVTKKPPKGKFCALSFRYAKDYKPRSNLSALKKLVMSTKMVVNINKNYTQGCQTATASCQTYHCKDENENDQFTYNACAEGANDGENKCNEPELDKFCAAPLKSRCEYCTDGYKCNSAKIDLEIIKKPPSATTNEVKWHLD